MKIHYFLLDPTRNFTILVDTPVPEDEHPALARDLMEKEPLAEQVGFLTMRENAQAAEGAGGIGSETAAADRKERVDICLRMAGGEFCGNATMSAAAFAYWTRKGRKADDLPATLYVRASGAKEPVRVTLSEMTGDKEQVIGAETSDAEMPPLCARLQMEAPVSVMDETFSTEEGTVLIPTVRFSGITHLICEKKPDEGTEAEPKRDGWQRRAEQHLTAWGKARATCMGIMFYDSKKNFMRPLVYCPDPESLVWESACASGTTALGAYLMKKEGHSVDKRVAEPGGSLRIEASADGTYYLSGTVRMVTEKVIEA